MSRAPDNAHEPTNQTRLEALVVAGLPAKRVRRQIFRIHIAKHGRDPDRFGLDALAAASGGYSGAEIDQVVIAALHDAFADSRELDTRGILDALAHSPPISVTMAESIARLRHWARDRYVPADR